jgi:hypothetical protein
VLPEEVILSRKSTAKATVLAGVGLTSVEILRADPRRVGFVLTSDGAVNLCMSPFPPVVFPHGVLIGTNALVQVVTDITFGPMVQMAWHVIATGPGPSTVTVFEWTLNEY